MSGCRVKQKFDTLVLVHRALFCHLTEMEFLYKIYRPARLDLHKSGIHWIGLDNGIIRFMYIGRTAHQNVILL